MGEIKGSNGIIWSDVFYDQALSLVYHILDEGIEVPWINRDKVSNIRFCLLNNAFMSDAELDWDYGDRTVRLNLEPGMESDVYRLMSEYRDYGFSFDNVSDEYSLRLASDSEMNAELARQEEIARDLAHDRVRSKRRSRENTARDCLERYIDDCRCNDCHASVDGFIKACGSRRIGRKTWRKYLT